MAHRQRHEMGRDCPVSSVKRANVHEVWARGIGASVLAGAWQSRLSRPVRCAADCTRGAQVTAVHVEEAQQLQTWEDEGGQSVFSIEPLRVLIVDNDVPTSDLLELMLHASGHETRVAHSGATALAIAAEFHPSVVLLELDLPDMSGYEVGRLLREHAQSHDLRLIALTSSRAHAGRELARVAGFERYLLKPVAALDLAELLRVRADRDE